MKYSTLSVTSMVHANAEIVANNHLRLVHSSYGALKGRDRSQRVFSGIVFQHLLVSMQIRCVSIGFASIPPNRKSFVR